MAVRLTCVDNASGHDGLRWRMGADAQSVTTVVGETAPGVGELVVSAPIEPEACFSVAAYSGETESAVVGVCADTVAGEDFSSAAIGDEIGGGIYAGTDIINGSSYHIIAGMADSEARGAMWKNSSSSTAGTQSSEDGLGNTLAMEAAGLADHPAAAHCLAYTGGGHSDWHMPARNQVTLLHTSLSGHPEFAENASSNEYTFASTEASSSEAWSRRIGSGFEIPRAKTDPFTRTRPIRRVLA